MPHSRGTFRRKTALGVCATLAGAALILSSCSSSGGKAAGSTAPVTSGGSQSSAATGSTAAPGIAAAQQGVDAAAKPFTTIPISTPLSKTPPKGKKVFFLSNQSGDWKRWLAGFSEAAKVLGWNPTILTTPGGPADFNGMAQQAIQQGANYIAVGGPVFPTNNAMVSAARAAKVPLFYFSTSQKPEGTSNWEFAAVGAASEYNARGKLLADQVITATSGKAHVLFLNTPEFLVFHTLDTAFKAEMTANCPACKVDTLNVTITDVLAGKAGSSVIAYLRSHSDINSLACNTSNFCGDVPIKAKAASIKIGKGGMPLVTASQGDGQLSWLGDGTAVSGQGTPYEYVGYQLVDAMARYSVGDSIEPNWKATLPEYLYTSQNSPTGTKPYEGPTGFRSQFKTLWKV